MENRVEGRENGDGQMGYEALLVLRQRRSSGWERAASAESGTWVRLHREILQRWIRVGEGLAGGEGET